MLALHLCVVAFNIFGLVAVPLGGWWGWGFVRVRWWRLLHLLSLALVAGQAVVGRACFLTLWQALLDGEARGAPPPWIEGWLNRLLYWPLPHWFFVTGYTLIWLYVLALWWLVPPRRRA